MASKLDKAKNRVGTRKPRQRGRNRPALFDSAPSIQPKTWRKRLYARVHKGPSGRGFDREVGKSPALVALLASRQTKLDTIIRS